MRFNPSINAAVTSDIQQSEAALQTAFQQVSTGQRVNQAVGRSRRRLRVRSAAVAGSKH